MSDGITDAKRECKPIKYILPKTPPTQCKGCVFITCSQHAQWECMNPIDTELLDKDGICIYHLTAGELAEYCRRRLMAKLKGGTKVQEDKVNRPPCKWLRKRCDYANQWYCKHPKSMKPDAFKSTDYCLGCSVYESQDESSKEVTPSMKVLHCKHQSGTSNKCQKSLNCNVYPCVFEITNEWDAAKVRCKYFEQHNDGMIRDVLARISEHDLTFLESMLKDDFEWTLEQIRLSLSSRYDP